MLCLTRKPGQSIIIADNIRIVICRVDGNTVRIGVEADKDVKVWREELLGREGKDAA